ncbi:MAG: hypothetical protein V4489_03175 [Chlamydiota bacterium]
MFFLVISLIMMFFAHNPIFAITLPNLHDNYKNLLENTIWLVPPSTLRAYSANGYVPETDQTVWVISQYDGGYFFGNSYTLIGESTFSQRQFIGTITNVGHVYITFYTEGASSKNTDLINGIGTFQINHM